MGKSIEEILKQMDFERNQKINEQQSALDEVNNQRDIARKDLNNRMRMYENLSGSKGTLSPPTGSALTILQYATDQGQTVNWGDDAATTFTLDPTLPNYSYILNTTFIPQGPPPVPDFLTGVTIGNTVTSIGFQAFYGCSSLASVIFTPTSVLTSIGDQAFHQPALSNCSLTSITIPDSVTSIGFQAFYGCSSLASVIFSPTSVLTSIGDQAFEDCTGLTSITIPDSVVSIGSFAFRNCSASTSLTFGNSVTSIGRLAFNDCVSLTTVSIPGTVGSISESAFANCTGLIAVTILSGVTNIDAGAFSGCVNLSTILIPATIVSIGDYAFYNTINIISIVIPNSVTSIDPNAFQNSGLIIVAITSATAITLGITSPATGVAFFGATVDTI